MSQTVNKRNSSANLINAQWPAPTNVQAFVTTRCHPAQADTNFDSAYANFNLASHVGDKPAQINAHRTELAKQVGLEKKNLCWLEQVHGQNIVAAQQFSAPPKADGSDTRKINQACIVMTADCLPVLLCDKKGTQVSAIHAGWRGLADGILEKAVSRFSAADELIAWLGPAISQRHFEVGQDVHEAFISNNPAHQNAFIPGAEKDKWMADIYQLARTQLIKSGVTSIFGGDFCTYTEAERFYSYRRDGAQSGRMASVIYLQ
jgi:YfiH family protein